MVAYNSYADNIMISLYTIVASYEILLLIDNPIELVYCKSHLWNVLTFASVLNLTMALNPFKHTRFVINILRTSRLFLCAWVYYTYWTYDETCHGKHKYDELVYMLRVEIVINSFISLAILLVPP